MDDFSHILLEHKDITRWWNPEIQPFVAIVQSLFVQVSKGFAVCVSFTDLHYQMVMVWMAQSYRIFQKLFCLSFVP